LGEFKISNLNTKHLLIQKIQKSQYMQKIHPCIDWVVYINLDRRTDRREEMEEELKRMGIEADRFSAIEHSVGIVGCGKSHLTILKEAKTRGCRNVMIMEDDFYFTISREEVDYNLNLIFDNNVPFDVMKLDYFLQKSEETEYEFLGRALESQTASCYIVANHYLDTIIGLYEESFPLLESTGMHWVYANDQVWKILQAKDKWLYVKQRFGKQRDGYSDNSRTFQVRD